MLRNSTPLHAPLNPRPGRRDLSPRAERTRSPPSRAGELRCVSPPDLAGPGARPAGRGGALRLRLARGPARRRHPGAAAGAPARAGWSRLTRRRKGETRPRCREGAVSDSPFAPRVGGQMGGRARLTGRPRRGMLEPAGLPSSSASERKSPALFSALVTPK